MQTITFECETITPMFLAGADGQTPELRAPSIKGALRFWWRAMNGHLGLEDKKDRDGKIIQKGLKTIEGEIFGNTSSRSKVIMRVQVQKIYKERTSSLPHKQRSFEKEAFSKGTIFTVYLSLTKAISCKEVVFNLRTLAALFILVSVLGGLGNRSRRGFGSFKIINQEYPQTLESILKHLHFISPHFKLEKNGAFIFSEKQMFDEYPYVEKIELGRSKAEILKRIGQTTHKLNKKWGKQYDYSLGHSNRLASPLYVSIIDSLHGFRPIITSLKTVTEKKYQQPSVSLQQEFKNTILR